MVSEVFKESSSAIWDARGLFGLLVVAVAVSLGLEIALRRFRGRAPGRWVHAVVLLAAMAGGLWLGWQEAFLCDDAYISFRYALNFAEGHGLVWNKGEWVEGYTNFLWTALLGVLRKLGADIPLAALFGCLLSFVAALWAAAAAVRRAAPKPPILPFAAIALAGAVPFHTFSTAGLETMPAAALVVGGMFASTLPRGALLAGLSLTLATLMRPDHALFLGCFGLAMAAEDLLHGEGKLWRRLRFRRYVELAAPFLLLYVPYFLLRWRAYGDFYPNTYYAKNGEFAHWSQGSVYAAHFIGSSGAWAWLPVALIALIGKARERHETRLRIFAALALVVFGRYVVRVGGDFMEYRFFVPLMPVMFVAVEIGLRWRIANARLPGASALTAWVATLGLAAALLPIRLIPPRAIKWSIAREPSFYRIRTVFPLTIDCPWETLGKNLATGLAARGVEPPVAAAAIGMLGYHSRIPIIDVFGLINRAIAHKPFKREGRPGHEKEATTNELMAQGAVLDVGHRGDPNFRELTEMRIGTAKLHFLRLDPHWAAQIARIPGAHVPQPAQDVERIARTDSRERVLSAHAFYARFLLGNPQREPLLAKLSKRLGAIADFEEKLPAEAKVEGKGLRVARGPRPGGASGEGWLTSLPDGKSKGVGRVEIPVGPIESPELRFVLGGTATDKVGVKLVLDGQTVFQASPKGGSDLVPVAWKLDGHQGKSGSLVIEDAEPAKNQGIVVDAVHFAPAEGDVRSRILLLERDSLPAFADLLQEARAILPEGDPERAAMESRVARRWSLDVLPEGTSVTGNAFGRGPVSAAVGGQGAVIGLEGTGFLNSHHGGDISKGRVELPMMELPAEPIVLMVGGGRACSRVYVGLEVAGKVVRRVCGRDDEALRRDMLPTRGYVGKQGRVVIVDEAEGAWGHILADDILVLKPPAPPPQP